MAQKGFIEYNDLIKPINRVHVLNSLNILKQTDSALNNIEKNEGGSIITVFSDNLIEIEQDNQSVYMTTKIYPKTAEVSTQGYTKPNRAANYFGEKFSANFKCKHE